MPSLSRKRIQRATKRANTPQTSVHGVVECRITMPSKRKGQYAKIEGKRDRVRRVFNVLKDFEYHSTLDLQTEAKVCAVGSVCSEVRRNLKRDDLPEEYQGFELPESVWRFPKYTKRGVKPRKVAMYRLEAV